jgi:gamma-glutamyltranspeptidase
MAVVLTSTVNLFFFGLQVLGPETGVIFNGQMDDLLSPGFPNAFGAPVCQWPSGPLGGLDNYPDSEPGNRPSLLLMHAANY